MKISELQKILERYKKENGDLKVRITAETRFGEQHEILDYDAIDTKAVYDKEEFNNLVNNMYLGKSHLTQLIQIRPILLWYIDSMV